ncbi:hypothetical protein STEG23_005582 [Scotinomys teguina]
MLESLPRRVTIKESCGADQPRYHQAPNQGYELVHSNIDLIYELLEHMKGPADPKLQDIHDTRQQEDTRGSPSEGPVSTVSQKSEASNQTNDSLQGALTKSPLETFSSCVEDRFLSKVERTREVLNLQLAGTEEILDLEEDRGSKIVPNNQNLFPTKNEGVFTDTGVPKTYQIFLCVIISPLQRLPVYDQISSYKDISHM